MARQNRVTVESVQEYKETIAAIDTLGMSVTDTHFAGTWELQSGDPVGPLRSKEIQEVGNKYFTLRLTDGSDGGTSMYKVRFATGWHGDDAELIVKFA